MGRRKDLSGVPSIGDIITFNSVWQVAIKLEPNHRYPVGVVTSIKKYGDLSRGQKELELTPYLIGTLAYPMTYNTEIVLDHKVYVVLWLTKDKNLAKNYMYINEEWFYNSSFLIVSRA